MYRKTGILKTVIAMLILTSLALSVNTITLLSQAQGQAGTTLSANVTASAIYLTEYKWEISKEANTSEVYLSQENPVATVGYTVSVTKTVTTSYYIEGYVCVKNGGERATEDLTISVDLYYHKGGGQDPWVYIGSYSVDVSSKPVLYPNESYCYYYKVSIPSDYWNKIKFKIDSKVTITNHSGRLGQPFGPSPDATTERSNVTYGYDCVDVEDSNGYTWCTCDSSSWSYNVEFVYDPTKGESYEHINTATIVQTNQSASWTVIVHQEIEMYATIYGVVFWDNNYNGVFDEGDKAISGVAVDLYKYDEETGEWVYVNKTYSDEYGYYYFSVEPGYTYKVVVTEPVCESCDLVVNTTPTYYVVENVESGMTYGGNDFGFVCLKKLTGAYSKGYWSWSQYNKRTGQWLTRVTQEDVNYINNKLGTGFTSPKGLADYLTSPVLGDMATALRQQLIATLLNLKYGYISEDTVVYYDGKYLTINEVVENAKSALKGGSRCEQEYWKDLLDAINNNYVYYVYKVDC